MSDDYGIKGSTSGVPVQTATDRELIYSSKWKSLKIKKEGSGTADGSGQATIAHGLDFVPAFLAYDEDNWKGDGYYTLNHTSYIDSTNLNIETANNTDYAYKVFANPISGTSSASPSDYDYGAKISESGEAVQDAKWDELALLSGVGTFQIWKIVELAVSADTDDTWTEGNADHDLGYVPAYVGWVNVMVEQSEAYFLVGNITAYTLSYAKQVQVDVCADNDKFYMRVYPHSGGEIPAGATCYAYLMCYEKLV